MDGIICYKAISGTFYPLNTNWIIEPGSVLTETVNYNRSELCGCGINVASLNWVKNNLPKSTYWKCLIKWKDLSDVVVPYNTDGKFRCAKLTLLEKVQ